MNQNKDFEHQDVKIYCATNNFIELMFQGPHNRPHGVRGLGKHYHMHFYPKLGHGTYPISIIPSACNLCTSILDQPWVPVFTEQQQLCSQPVKDCTYWPVLGSFNNWNIIKL